MTSTTYDRPALLLQKPTALNCRTSHSAVVEDLAFVHWQHHANEKAYANKLITKPMYEFARDELRKSIDQLSKICYSDFENR